MAIHEANEYVFTTPTRRLLVRQAREPADHALETTAKGHAEQLASLFDVRSVQVSPVGKTSGGAEAVTIIATVTGPAPDAPRLLQSAIVRFPSGPVVELTLDTPATDPAAEGEFRRLVESVRPAPAGASAVARTLATGPTGKAAHPVGPVLIDLTPEYHLRGPLVLDAADGSASYRVEMTTPAVEADKARAAGQGSTLLGAHAGAEVGVATGEDGQPVRYEAGTRPRLRRRRDVTPAEAAPAFRGTGDSPGVVNGVLQGTLVQIRVTVRNAQESANELGRRLLRDLGGTPTN